MANSPTELITQFVDSLVDLVATRVQEKHGEALKVYVDLYLHNAVDKRISAKLSDYNPTEHTDFHDAVVDAMDGEVTRNWVEDAIETGLEKYDPADSRYFSDAVNDLISDSDRLKSLVRDVLTDNSFELVMS